MSTTTKPFTLSDFVSCDETRPSILKPWKHGKHVYATDGRVMVRISADLFPEVTTEPNVPQAATDSLFAASLPDEHWISPTPEMRAVTRVKCDKCIDGFKECTECGHHGECDYCDGAGFSVPHTPLKIGNTYLNQFYIAKLCRLPGVMLHLPPEAPALDVVHFRFEYGIGVLMPMRTS